MLEDEFGNYVQIGDPFFREERVDDSECCDNGFIAACTAAPICANEIESTDLTFEDGLCLESLTDTEICRVNSVEVSRGTPV